MAGDKKRWSTPTPPSVNTYGRQMKRRESERQRLGALPTKNGKGALAAKYKAGLVRQEYYGLTNQEVADEFGITKDTWQRKRSSPDGKRWLAAIHDVMDDVKALVTAQASAVAVDAMFDLVVQREAAQQAGDYKEAAKINKWIIELIGLPEPQTRDADVNATQVVINLPPNAELLRPLDVKTSYREIPAEPQDD